MADEGGIGMPVRLAERFRRSILKRGLAGTITLAALSLWRTVFRGSSLVYRCDLNALACSPLRPGLQMLCARTPEELSRRDREILQRYLGEKEVERQFSRRFDLSCELWLARRKESLVGFHWCRAGGSLGPFFVTVGKREAHLFDGEIFPRFRGLALNSILVESILRDLRKRGFESAYIAVRRWNAANIRSLGKTSFRLCGKGRMLGIVGWRIRLYREGA